MAHNNRAAEYRDKGDHAQAMADCDRAIHLDPWHDYAYYNRGEAHRRLGLIGRAEADLVQALVRRQEAIRQAASRR